jgi:arginine repressor
MLHWLAQIPPQQDKELRVLVIVEVNEPNQDKNVCWKTEENDVMLYLDTSAAVKVYVDELYSDTVVSAIAQADTVVSHVIAY